MKLEVKVASALKHQSHIIFWIMILCTIVEQKKRYNGHYIAVIHRKIIENEPFFRFTPRSIEGKNLGAF